MLLWDREKMLLGHRLYTFNRYYQIISPEIAPIYDLTAIYENIFPPYSCHYFMLLTL